jgi:hypothetical protein
MPELSPDCHFKPDLAYTKECVQKKGWWQVSSMGHHLSFMRSIQVLFTDAGSGSQECPAGRLFSIKMSAGVDPVLRYEDPVSRIRYFWHSISWMSCLTLYIYITNLIGSYANYYKLTRHKMDLARVIVLWRSLSATGAGDAAEALVIS